MVIWSEPAKADLRHIFEYIAHDSHHYAKKVTQEIVDKTAVLNELPRIGRAVRLAGRPFSRLQALGAVEE